jgi:hypothetical protein
MTTRCGADEWLYRAALKAGGAKRITPLVQAPPPLTTPSGSGSDELPSVVGHQARFNSPLPTTRLAGWNEDA